MREIKFRAWDKERNEMRKVTSMDWLEWWVSTAGVWERTALPPLTYGERNSFKNEETDRHILMQYTGLKEKNGIDIYEKDRFKHGKNVGTVEYIEDGFKIVWDEPNIEFFNDILRNHIGLGEVVGNVYETALEPR